MEFSRKLLSRISRLAQKNRNKTTKLNKLKHKNNIPAVQFQVWSSLYNKQFNKMLHRRKYSTQPDLSFKTLFTAMPTDLTARQKIAMSFLKEALHACAQLSTLSKPIQFAEILRAANVKEMLLHKCYLML